MAVVVSSLFRVFSLAVLVFTVYCTHALFFEDKPMSLDSTMFLLRFLTVTVLVVLIFYHALATPLQLLGKKNLHSAIYHFAFSISLLVGLLFWGIFLYDPTLLVNRTDLRLPMWFNHLSHTFGFVALLIDALLWKPAVAPVSPAFILLSMFSAGYITYVEYLMRVKQIYAYPLLANMSENGRFGFYGSVLLSMFLGLILCKQFVRLLNRSSRKKSKSQQKHDKKESAQVVTNKQKKSKKVD